MIKLDPVLLDKIIAHLKNEVDGLQGIYMFGSYVSGLATVDSDVDLAVFSKNKLTSLECWNLATACAIILKCDVDLVDLRSVNTILQYQIINEGQRIYTHNKLICDRYENYILNLYLDFKEFRIPLIKDIVKRGSVYG